MYSRLKDLYAAAEKYDFSNANILGHKHYIKVLLTVSNFTFALEKTINYLFL